MSFRDREDADREALRGLRGKVEVHCEGLYGGCHVLYVCKGGEVDDRIRGDSGYDVRDGAGSDVLKRDPWGEESRR